MSVSDSRRCVKSTEVDFPAGGLVGRRLSLDLNRFIPTGLLCHKSIYRMAAGHRWLCEPRSSSTTTNIYRPGTAIIALTSPSRPRPRGCAPCRQIAAAARQRGGEAERSALGRLLSLLVQSYGSAVQAFANCALRYATARDRSVRWAVLVQL